MFYVASVYVSSSIPTLIMYWNIARCILFGYHPLLCEVLQFSKWFNSPEEGFCIFWSCTLSWSFSVLKLHSSWYSLTVIILVYQEIFHENLYSIIPFCVFSLFFFIGASSPIVTTSPLICTSIQNLLCFEYLFARRNVAKLFSAPNGTVNFDWRLFYIRVTSSGMVWHIV